MPVKYNVRPKSKPYAAYASCARSPTLERPKLRTSCPQGYLASPSAPSAPGFRVWTGLGSCGSFGFGFFLSFVVGVHEVVGLPDVRSFFKPKKQSTPV